MYNIPISKVVIHCMTYNHGPYIRQCLDGFTMQKTDFPFAVIIVDDLSTDKGPDLLWDFINNELDEQTRQQDETEDYVRVIASHKENHNCTFAIYFLKYNHHSINKKKDAYIKEWDETPQYIAMCEGDDYWIDSKKLQKQVDIFERNPSFTMVCNRTKLYSERRKKYIGENYCYNKSRVVNPKDVIYRTGLFISTCSILYKKTIRDNIPEYWANCKVGDYPLQIMCAMKGKIFYCNDIMSVYRIENSNSWMGRQQWGRFDLKRIEVIKSQVNMFKGFGQDFPQYKKFFKKKIANHINRFIPANCPTQEVNQYLEYFHEDIEKYNLIQKYDLWMCKLSLPRVRFLHKMLFHHMFSEHRLYYGKKSLPLWLLDKIKSKLY